MAEKVYKSMSLAHPHPPFRDGWQTLFVVLGLAGVLIMTISLTELLSHDDAWLFYLSLTLMATGVIGFAARAHLTSKPGIQNNGIWFSNVMNRGAWAWLLGIVLTGFYVVLYWFPSALGYQNEGANTGLVAFFNPLSMWIKNEPASQWFVYGTLYTLAILVFGVKFIWKYRHNRYHVIRTCSVMFFQLGFAFLIPEFLQKLNYPYYDAKNMWPLNYYFFEEWQLKAFLNSGNLGLWMLIFGILMIFIVSPVLTYLYGKRWYCSWVCGCGGLAETAGDSFRHLSDKSLSAWRIERWLVHSVLVFVFVMTVAVIYSFLHNGDGAFYISKTVFIIIVAVILFILVSAFNLIPPFREKIGKKIVTIFTFISGILLTVLVISYFAGSSEALIIDHYKLRQWYGFLIGAAFSGVIGVGFYPLMGNRVWCRFGCPMAAILGIQQKVFSRFRISTNGGQCISCGNCSTYCEMGIDVRAYAQKGQNIVRASCVGCGICAAVCPRGVLKLENANSDIFQKVRD